MTVNKPSLFQGLARLWEIGATQHNVYILRVADSGLVYTRHPCGYGVPSSHRIGHLGLFQSMRNSEETLTDSFNSATQAFPGNFCIGDEGHGADA